MDGHCDQNLLTSTNENHAEDTESMDLDYLDHDAEEYPCDHQGTTDADTRMYTDDQDQRITDLGPVRRISPEASAFPVVMSVMAATGFLVMCAPLLPRKHSANKFFATLYVLRNIIVTLLVISALVGTIWLTLKVVQLHKQGLVLWPRRCTHCFNVFSQIKLHDKNIADGRTVSLNRIPNSLRKELIDNSTIVSNVTLNIAYIFSALVLLFMLPEIVFTFLCLNEHSPQNAKAETNIELIIQLLVLLSLFIFVYIFSFYLIPSFYDAHFVAVPKIWWSFLLLIQVSVWISIQKLVRPFAILANGENRTTYACPMNSTLGEILMGILDISQPFSAEFPVMMTCVLIEMWSQNLPRQVQNLMKDSSQSIGCFKSITRRSNWITLRDFTNTILKRRKLPQNKSEHSLLLNNDIEMEFVISTNVRSDNLGDRINHNLISSHPRHDNSMRNEIERALSLTLLICVIYFGISNYLLAGDSKLRGRYTQWLLRMAFFTPELLVIMKQTNMTRKGDNYSARRTEPYAHKPSKKNITMLLLSLSGACLLDMFCLVSSLGNLMSGSELSRDETVLNVVSIFSCVFGFLCKCIQCTFILRVEHQQPKDYNEMKWTLVCLLIVGMTNATQWLFDSLVHEEGSSSAWPVLSMFFEGNIGLVVGMLFVPFLHLYELHIAIMAYEIYKQPWNVKST